ncbi:MAG: Nramp family divalent metal transporter, partial [Bacillota bacterium]|nr:Nramp family divalent metal transporter [Bacillota bacterium]
KPWTKNLVLFSAMLASISTAMAEILGGGIALNILFKIPTKLGAFLVMLFVLFMLYTNSYKKLEKTIVAFVSIIGFSFILELTFIHIEWHQAIIGLIKPTFPKNSMPVIMSVLGAVVMPHNLFLHSEIIQSRQWNLEDEKIIEKQLKYEFLDTFFSMFVGLVINSAMIIVASSTFYEKHVQVTELNQAYEMLKPMLGNSASIIFAVALLFAGLSAAMTAGMSGGSIFSGIFKEPYDSKDIHTKLGIGITIVTSMLVVLMISNYFDGLVYSQMFLSMQLPITVFTQIYLTSSKKVMGKYANSLTGKAALWVIGIVVAVLNVALLLSYTMFGHI